MDGYLKEWTDGQVDEWMNRETDKKMVTPDSMSGNWTNYRGCMCPWDCLRKDLSHS